VNRLAALLRTRSVRSLGTCPDAAGWRHFALALGAFGAFALASGLGLGFFRPGPTTLTPATFLRAAAILFLFPGIAEELVFRGWLLPHPSEHRPPAFLRKALLTSVVVFTLWHVVNAWLIFPQAREVFWDGRFLLIVVGLGWACGSVYLRTGSLWPAVLIHWSIVIVWKAFLGGPVFFA
jgi:predicted Abi (CAAX) family protease